MNSIGASKRDEALKTFADAYAARRKLEGLRSDIERAEQEASSAEKARQAFLSGLNHELRTPLNHIIGFAELLKQADEYGFGEDKKQEYLDLILGAAGTLLDQINAILVSAGYGEPTPAPDSAGSLVTVLRRVIQENTAKLFVGKVDIADDVPPSMIASRDLYKSLQMVFSALTDKARERRTLGVKVNSPAPGEREIVLVLSVLSAHEGLTEASLNAARTELINHDGRLEVTSGSGTFQIFIGLPIQEQRQVA
ncbi:MAG: hypothetical protein HRU11_06365 [Parvularculaceae bacterium]|nr:hypothetical protein [Parvularculaceae bacterium]